MRQDLGEAHQRKLVHGEQALQTLFLALRTADAGEAHAAAGFGLERRHQARGEIVA